MTNNLLPAQPYDRHQSVPQNHPAALSPASEVPQKKPSHQERFSNPGRKAQPTAVPEQPHHCNTHA